MSQPKSHTGESHAATEPRLLAISDLHSGHRGNSELLERIQPSNSGDWLIVAGDVGERVDEVLDTLATIAPRFAKTVWVPGNHELWTTKRDPGQLGGVERYMNLVSGCRERGITTPEDEPLLWTGAGGPAWVVPLFLLYDYTWRVDASDDQETALEKAYKAHVVASDEYLISTAPFASAVEWCADRLRVSMRKLADLDPAYPTVLINHWPLRREPTEVLHYPEFALWCGTTHTHDWHLRYRAKVCVYGHLHIPRTHHIDGVRFEECSIGYPREWRQRGLPDPLLRQILPAPDPSKPQVRWAFDSAGRPYIAGFNEDRVLIDQEQGNAS